jgi:AcrR family transcriptional regulator
MNSGEKPMRHKSAPQLALATRDRILEAAMLRFSRYSYEETGLRDVAADVGIDVAYVHRCFGSKENLFAESLAATIQAESLFDGSTDDQAHALARQIFVSDQNKVGPLDIIIRSLSCPQASRVICEFVVDDFIGPLAQRLDQPPGVRLALIAAVLAGVGLFRDVLHVAPLLDTEGRELEPLISKVISGLMDADAVAG